MRIFLGSLIFFLLWSGPLLAGDSEERPETENPYQPYLSAESNNLWGRFVDAYDRHMERPFLGRYTLSETMILDMVHSAPYWVGGATLTKGLELLVSGFMPEGGAFALVGLTALLAGHSLFLEPDAVHSYRKVAARPEFAALAETVAAHRNGATEYRPPCRASFLALANPFRRSRIASRWAPATIGAAMAIGFHEIAGGSQVLRSAVKTLRELPKAITDRFEPVP